MFKNLVLRPVIQSLVSPLAGGLTSLVTGQTGAGSALTGGANLFNAGVNAYGLASGVNTLSGALYGSALGSSAVTSVAATYAGAGTAGANFGGLVAIDTAVAGTAAGSAAGAAGSLSAALGSVPVYGWIALAVVAAAAYFSKEVTPHVGGYVASDSLGRLTDITAQQGGIKNSDTQKAVASLVTPLTAALNATAKTFGQEAGFGLRAVFESDSTDPSFGLFSVLKDGAKIGGFDALGTLDKDPIKGLGEFSVLAAASVRDALLSVDLPMWASDALKAIADSAGVDAVVKVADDINATQAAFVALGKHLTDLGGTFALIGGFSSDATFKLVQAAGGLDALSGALSSYYENFYSDAERNTTSAGLIAKALAEVSIAVPSTVAGLQALGRDGFRALVDAAAAVGDTAAVSALLGVSEAFAELTPGVGAFAEATRSAADILNERAGLETKLLQAQGDTAGLRARELAGLDESNRGIQQHINEIEDATAAQAVADKRLADHAAAAAAAIDQIAAASRRVADAGAGVKSALQNIADFGDAIRSDIASTRSAINDLRGQALTQLAAARGAFVAAIKDMGAQAAAAAAKVDAAAGTLASARLKVTSAITALASALDTQGARVQSAQGAITSAQEAITAAYVSAADRVRTALQSLADGVTSATSAVASVRSRITDAYLGAVRENETAQQRLVDLQKQAAQVTQKQATDLRSFSGSIVEFLARLNGAEVGAGAAQYGASSSRFTSLAQAAISGDASAFSGLTDAARIFLDSSKNNAKTAQQFDADTVRVRQLLSQAQAVAAATGSDPAAATLDLSAQIAQAQADAAHTLSEVERLRAIAEVAGAATAQPAIDLLGEYRAAQAGLTAAQSAYNTAASTAAGFGVTLGAAGSEFAAAALALGAAVDAVTTSGASRAAAETDLLAGYTKAVADLSAEQAAFAAMVRQLAAAGVDLTKADTTGAFDKLVIDFAASVADVAAAEAAHTLAVSDSTAAALAYTAALDTAAGLGVAITADLSALSVATTDFAAALATANAVSASTFDAAAGVVEQYQTLAARLLTLNGDLASFELRTADLDFSGLAQLDPLGTLLQTYAGAVKTLLDAVADQSRLKATETFVDIGGGLERYTSTGGASLVRSAGASLAESTLYAKDGGAVNGQAAADWVAARFAEGDLQAIYDKAIALGVSSRSLQALSGVGNDVLAWATAHGLPAFAGGGSTRGGLYLAGERGPELINSGPARIWNAAETASIFGGGDMAGEIRALRDEVKALRADRRADMPALVDAARSTAKTLTSWDAGGGAYVQTESGVTLTTSL